MSTSNTLVGRRVTDKTTNESGKVEYVSASGIVGVRLDRGNIKGYTLREAQNRLVPEKK